MFTYKLTLVRPDTNFVADLDVINSSQIVSHPTKPNSVSKCFIILPLSLENFEVMFEPKYSKIQL